MILIAKSLRGGPISLTDAFFPLIVLNWGQAENLIWGWQLQSYSSMALSAIALLLTVQSKPRLRHKDLSPGEFKIFRTRVTAVANGPP